MAAESPRGERTLRYSLEARGNVDTQDTTAHYYPIRLETPPSQRAKSVRYEAQIIDEQRPRAKTLIYLKADSVRPLPKQGDTLLVYTAWHRPDSIGAFDYATYLHRQGIVATAYIAPYAWQVVGKNQRPWWRNAEAWQQRLKDRYQTLGIGEEERATIDALTLGYREDLEPERQRQFSAAGAMHVLAVSGLHTGILMWVIIALLTLFGRRKPMYEQRGRRCVMGCVVIGALIAYAWLTGCTPSVVRAVVMGSMVMVAKMLRRHNTPINTLCAAGWLILLVRPMDLYAVSFQLSFAAVLAIILFMPGWQNAMGEGYWATTIGMSLAATIGTMPLTLYYYGQISNYMLLTNLIVLPLAWAMMVGGVLTLTIGWVTPIGKVLAWGLNGVTWLMNESVGWIEQLPYAVTQVVLPEWGMWVLVAVNGGVLVAWRRVFCN